MSNAINSILIEMDALIDYKLSYINNLIHTGRINATDNFNKDLMNMDINTLKFYRMNYPKKLSRLIMNKDKWDDDTAEDVFNLLLERDHDDIFSDNYKYVITTDISRLISAYNKAGNGVVKVAVRASYYSEEEIKWLNNTYSNIDVINDIPHNIDMHQFSRLIVGDYKTALEYDIEGQPKSIIVMNYRDNFDAHDISLLNPELIINLGDIHDIRVMKAYNIFNGGNQDESN